MNTIKNNVGEVYQFYVDKAMELCYEHDTLEVLKTDCHNESGIFGHSKPIIPRVWDWVRVTALEIDQTVINKAKDNIGKGNWEAIQGDIRSLPFLDKSFDLVMDFSTIDHVHYNDLAKVIQEYRRVSRKFLVVVWTSKHSRTCGVVPGQYYFNKEFFEERLMPYCSDVESYVLWVHPNNKEDVLRVYEGKWK